MASRNVPLAAVHNPYAIGRKCTGGEREGLKQCFSIPEDTPEVDRHAAMTWVYPSNIPVREYQKSIVSRALFSNTLVCLPTGMGKTLIAAVVMANFHRWYPKGQIIFMSPTKPLVNQQIRACHDVMGLLPERTAELQGSVKAEERKALWKERHIFYCTPQSLVNDIASRACLPIRTVCIVVDESHRATGNYAYVQAIKAIAAENPTFRVLALSATPGSKSESIQKVLNNLRISAIECWGEDDPEIVKHSHLRQEEVIKCPIGKGLADLRSGLLVVMKPILQKLISNHIIHAMQPENVHPYVCIMAREKLVKASQDGKGLDDLALLAKLANVKDNLGTHGAADLCSKLDGWEEEIRLGSCKSRALEAMLCTTEFQNLSKCAKRLTGGGMLEGGKGSSVSHPKLAKLRDVLTEHFHRYTAGGQSTRAIVFSQFRSSVDEIVSFLEGEELLSVCRFVGQGSSSSTSIGVASTATSSKPPPPEQHNRQLKLNSAQEAKAKNTVGKPLEVAVSFSRGQSQKVQKAVLTNFRNGVYNCLVATCIAEEGLDVGEVDLIVSYDCLSSPVRMVQRMGRTGRKRPGRVVTLVTEGIEESKLKSSSSKSKRIVNLLKKKGKFTLHPELNSRMIPPEITPQMVQEDIVIPEYRASQVGGACSRKTGNQRDLGSIDGNGGSGLNSNTNSTSWRLTTSQLKKLKECYSAEITYEADQLLGWVQSRSCFRTVRFPHSLQTLALLDVHCFVENQEWDMVYNKERMVAMLDLWRANNNMNGRNDAAAAPFTHVQGSDSSDDYSKGLGEEEEEEVCGPSACCVSKQPKAPSLQNCNDQLNNPLMSTSGMVGRNNEKNIIKMQSREPVLETKTDTVIYSNEDTTLLGLETSGKRIGHGRIIEAKSIGEVQLVQREDSEKSLSNSQEHQVNKLEHRNDKPAEPTWRIEGSKNTPGAVSWCCDEEALSIEDNHRHFTSEEESFHKSFAENDKEDSSHSLLHQTRSSSLLFPLFDVAYKTNVNDDAGCVPREVRRTDLPATVLLDIPIPPMGQRWDRSRASSYEQLTPPHDNSSLDFLSHNISSSTTSEGGRRSGVVNEQKCVVDSPVVIEQCEKDFRTIQPLNIDMTNIKNNGEEEGEEEEEGTTSKVGDFAPPPLLQEYKERERGDVLSFPSQSTTSSNTCDIRCIEEKNGYKVDSVHLSEMAFSQSDLQDGCDSTCSSAVCGVCGGEESLNDDPIVICDGIGCDVAVHTGCFGILEIPEGEWHCDTCKFSLSRNDRNSSSSSSSCDMVVCCDLCKKNGGVMKQTKGRVWVHLVCAVWTPEIGIEDSEPSVIPRSPSLVDPERAFLRCVECTGLGGGVQCSTSHCLVAVHPFYALKAGYKLCFPSPDDNDEEEHHSFLLHCRGHSKCSPLFSSSSIVSSEDAKKKTLLIQLVAVDTVKEIQREAAEEAAGTGSKKCEFQWHTPSLGAVTQLIEQRIGMELR